jgi:hypothetical protein
VNDALHVNTGFAALADFQPDGKPQATFDLTPVFGENIKKAHRKFIKPDDSSIIVEDHVEINENTKSLTWQLLTQAAVEIVPGGAILRQEGKEVILENISHPDLLMSVVSLDPAPLELDRQMEGLKRLEIRVPAWTIKDGKDVIRVQLSGN